LIYGSVCSGISSESVAWKPLGWSPAWFSEIAPFPSAVLAHRYPQIPNLGDVNKIHEKAEFKKGEIDILVGGTPCQGFSQAGRREGFGDPRARLALRFLEVAEMLRPRWLLWENVPEVLSSNGGKDFGALLWKMGKLGYGYSWHVLDARDFGLAQSRRRIFLVGHHGDWRRAAAALFERGRLEPSAQADTGAVQERPDDGRSYWNGRQLSETLQAGGMGQAMPEKQHFEAVLDEEDGKPFLRWMTPVECERLQGYPDNYSRIPWKGKAEADCPKGPRYKAVGNGMAVPVVRWVGERIAFLDSLPEERIKHFLPAEDLAKTLTDSELVERCVRGFRKLKEIIPYLREARERFAKPGRRVPVAGSPTWTEWVEQSLGVSVRRVQQLLREAMEPGEIVSRGPKQPRKLAKGDWRRLLKVYENRLEQVFGPLEDQKELAEAIRKFAQGIADRFSERQGRLLVSVSVEKP
jgi:DNA (cytosine-5)-methyltransferase 1